MTDPNENVTPKPEPKPLPKWKLLQRVAEVSRKIPVRIISGPRRADLRDGLGMRPMPGVPYRDPTRAVHKSAAAERKATRKQRYIENAAKKGNA